MKRRLTPEEQELWRYVTRNDTPLAPAESPEPEISAQRTVQPKTFPQVRPWKQGMHSQFSSPPSAGEPALASGAYAGIDRATAERFRKGDYPIDATLDLHGMSREKAHIMLVGFLTRYYENGARCLLVITGKGRKNADSHTGKGILQELLPRWLAEPGLKSMILALEVARPKHGGAGAYYLLLRRKRPHK